MTRFISHVIAVAALLAAAPETTLGGVPSDQLLPSSTAAYVSVGDWQQLRESWNRTQLAELMADPVMEPFAKDLRKQIDEKFSLTKKRLGLSFDDLKELPSGELALGYVHTAHQDPSLVLLADVTDNVDRAESLMSVVRQRLQQRGAKRSTRDVEGVEVVIYELPKDEETGKRDTAAYLLHDNMLVAADQVDVLVSVLGRFSGEHDDTLAATKPYGAVMQRCAEAAGDLVPHIRWFVDPFALIDALRASLPPERRKSADMINALKKTGFTAIKGLGGYINASSDGFELVHRTKIFAPKPYEMSMRMLSFPDGGELAPQKWVPTDVASYASVHIDILNAFDNFGPLFDNLFGEGEEDEGLWEDVKQSLIEDPYGPQVDLREEIFVHLGTRITMISDYELPITTTSQRRLIAIEAKNAEALMAGVKKSLEVDETVKIRKFRGHVIWEMVEPEDEEAPLELEIEGLDTGFGESDEEDEQEEGVTLPNAAVCVAYGNLFLASHPGIIEKVLAKAEDDPRLLSDMVDYQQVVEQQDRVDGSGGFGIVFVRLDEEIRANYELMRTGQMPQSETGLGGLLNGFLGSNEPGAPIRKAEFDASKLPEFQVVRRYLGPSGAYMRTDPDGWFIVGYLMTRQNATPAVLTAEESSSKAASEDPKEQ